MIVKRPSRQADRQIDILLTTIKKQYFQIKAIQWKATVEGYQKEYSIKAGRLNIYMQYLQLLQIDRRQTNKQNQSQVLST